MPGPNTHSKKSAQAREATKYLGLLILLAGLTPGLLGCGTLQHFYYEVTGKMSPEYATERGHPECAGKTAERCLELQRAAAQQTYAAEQQKQDENMILAGMAVCEKVGLPRKCLVLLAPDTLEKRYASVLGPNDRITFEMAQNLYFEIERNAAEARRQEEAQQNAAMLAQAVISITSVIRQSYVNTLLNSQRVGRIECVGNGSQTTCTYR